MIPARLDPLEMALAKGVAHARARNAKTTGAADRTHSPDPLAMDVGGAAAEYVVARHVDRFWNALAAQYHGALDVGRGPFGLSGQWDVKWTRLDAGHLIVQPGNPPDRTYVLVVGEPPDLRIVGAVSGDRACTADYWRGAGWWVPQTDLIPWGVEL
jgi:hypothetical protein